MTRRGPSRKNALQSHYIRGIMGLGNKTKAGRGGIRPPPTPLCRRLALSHTAKESRPTLLYLFILRLARGKGVVRLLKRCRDEIDRPAPFCCLAGMLHGGQGIQYPLGAEPFRQPTS